MLYVEKDFKTSEIYGSIYVDGELVASCVARYGDNEGVYIFTKTIISMDLYNEFPDEVQKEWESFEKEAIKEIKLQL
jgi:hypothetical protein